MDTNKCPKCKKTVYLMEKATGRLQGHDWHKNCFRCGKCEKSLSSHYCEHDGWPYCQNCYNMHYRPKGYGQGASGLSSHVLPDEQPKVAAPLAPAPAARAPAPAPPAAGPRFCGQCGNARVGDARFCGQCGSPYSA